MNITISAPRIELALINKIRIRKKAFSEAMAIYEPKLAPLFSPFDFIIPNEIRLSTIIAWLLCPYGTHAQGACFLNLFCHHYEIAWPTPKPSAARVKTEFLIDDGASRLDVVVFAETGQPVFAIENKPWATDGENQVSRYLKWLREKKRSDDKTTNVLIYLSGTGRAPEENSVNKGELESATEMKTLIVTAYSSLIPWLANCRKESGAPRVTAFIREFESYIQRTFIGVTDMTETHEIAKEIAGSPDMIRAAFSIKACDSELKNILFMQLCEQIAGLFSAKGIEIIVENNADVNRKWSGIAISFNKNSKYRFSIECELPGFNDVAYGLARRDESYDTSAEKIAFERNKLMGGNNRTSPGWPWYRNAKLEDDILPMSRYWEKDPLPWVEIAEGILAKNIVDAAERFRSAIANPDIL